MSAPDSYKHQYHTLYHAFTSQYTRVNKMINDFYPAVKKFVDGTEPEINLCMKKLKGAATQETTPQLYEAVLVYMSAFDDFTLCANKALGELNTTLKGSEALITRVMHVKQANLGEVPPEQAGIYSSLINDLNELMSRLENGGTQVLQLEDQMHGLMAQWKKAKARIP